MSAATFGLIAGALIGSPLGRTIIDRKNLKPKAIEDEYDINNIISKDTSEVEFDGFLKHFAFILISVALSIFLCDALVSIFPGFILPIVGMLVDFLNVGIITAFVNLVM